MDIWHRIGALAHEFTHTIDMKLRFDCVAEEGFNAYPKSKRELLLSHAEVIWEEYRVERSVFDTEKVRAPSEVP